MFVIPDLPIPLGFEKPIRSPKTGEMISFSDYVREMHEAMKSNALQVLSEKKKRYEFNVNNNVLIKAQVIGNGLSGSDVIIDLANRESRFDSIRICGIERHVQGQSIGKCI